MNQYVERTYKYEPIKALKFEISQIKSPLTNFTSRKEALNKLYQMEIDILNSRALIGSYLFVLST